MYCPKCNTCYLDDGKFCQDCGAPLVQNSIYKEKKPYSAKTIVAVAVLALVIAAGYAFFKEDSKGPAPAGKAPDAAITGSAPRLTAGNSASPGTAVKRHARSTARNAAAGGETAAYPAATSGAVTAAAPAAAAVPKEKPCAATAPPAVGAPRPANTAGQASASSAAHRDAATQKPSSRQLRMAVIRDPLSAEKRN